MRKLLFLIMVFAFFAVSAATAFAIVEKDPLRSLKKASHSANKSAVSDPLGGKVNTAGNKEVNGDDLLEDALALVEDANNLIDQGRKGQALEILDKAYRMVIEGDDDNSRQKDDLRLAISKAIVGAYAATPVKTTGIKSEIPLLINSDVEAEIYSFQTRERDFFISAYQRSAQYRFAIAKELRKAGLPEELSWLPLVESGFKVNALSRARALGLWQFIPSTGYRYGLTRDVWIDERLDPTKATRAAIIYMLDLHALFGDWLTVLAAYNCGEGKVMRSIRKQPDQFADYFWDLYRQLPRETARYVPRFLATLHIVKNPSKYGFDLPKLSEPSLDYKTIKTEKAMKLDDIAKLAAIDEGDLASLNAELRFKATPNREYQLRVPKAAYAKVEQIIANVPEWKRVEKARGGLVFMNHKVASGETLASIAAKYGTSVRQIRKNNKVAIQRGLTVGMMLRIPVRTHNAEKASSAGKPSNITKAPVATSINGAAYRVSRGDTLSSISRKAGITVEELKRLNGMKQNTLRVGQTLKIK